MPHDVSCLIPTRNRPDFLRRCLLFMKLDGVSCPILVADSSDEKHKAETKSVCEAAGLASIRLLRYDPEVGFYQKLASALGEIETPFVYFLADDDFMLFHGIERCVEELKGRPELAAAAGTLYVYNLSRCNPRTGLLPHLLSIYPQKNELSDDHLLRVSAHLANYTATFYSVYGSGLARRAFVSLARRTKHMRLGELYSSAYVLALGKRAMVPVIMGLRVSHDDAAHRHIPKLEDECHSHELIQNLHTCVSGLMELVASPGHNAEDHWPHLVEATRRYLLRVFTDPVAANKLALSLTLAEPSPIDGELYPLEKGEPISLKSSSPTPFPQTFAERGEDPVLSILAFCEAADRQTDKRPGIAVELDSLASNLSAMPFLSMS